MSNVTANSLPIGISILGATGSIGLSTLDVVERHPQRYKIVALSANKQTERLENLCIKYNPKYAVMNNADCAEQLRIKLAERGLDTQVLSGENGLNTIATLDEVKYVMAAIVGAAGLKSTLAAAKSGKRVLLANKEALVMSGEILMQTVEQFGAELLPIDSEHNAIFQCMPNNDKDFIQNGIKKILLTASGGPFRNLALEKMRDVTPRQACDHPNWKMGPKISVDSATMMNKGLEVIEACWLFNTTTDFVQVVLHPQSIIHSMVEYADGSILAQLGNPDMRTPIAHALAWPDRMSSGVDSLDLFKMDKLEFTVPDLNRFPCLRLAIEAIQQGGTCPTILNAANEIAVDAFLAEKVGFTDIAMVIDKTLSQVSHREADSLQTILDDDQSARLYAQDLVGTVSTSNRIVN